MYVTIINDCADPGTMNRQVVRAATLFPATHISPVAVGAYADLEASGMIIDTIDGATLSLVTKFGLAKEIEVYDIPTVLYPTNPGLQRQQRDRFESYRL